MKREVQVFTFEFCAETFSLPKKPEFTGKTLSLPISATNRILVAKIVKRNEIRQMKLQVKYIDIRIHTDTYKKRYPSFPRSYVAETSSFSQIVAYILIATPDSYFIFRRVSGRAVVAELKVGPFVKLM